MRAALMREVGAPLVVEDVTPAPLGPGQVLVAIEASGVCHSDLTILRDGMGGLAPVILGHEGAGTVLEVGAGVDDLAPGDRVIGAFVPACGDCWHCVRGRTNFCRKLVPVAMTTHWHDHTGDPAWSMSGLGTFAEQMAVQRISLVKVETDLPAEQLALIGCAVMTGVGAALNTARVEPGATVAVIGCGGVGQFVVQGARIAGAARIIAIDPVASKRDMAVANGATDTIDPTAVDAVAEVRRLTRKRGVDDAFEVVGSPQTILDAHTMVRSGGTAVIVGMPRAGARVTFEAADLFSTEKRLLGSFYGSGQVRRDFPRLVALADAGRLDLASSVTERIGLDDVNRAFEAMERGDVIRSVIVAAAR
jgi:S-(hydroxymethyl)glutathione dehydrogenase/alcohol dehydrogenase